jgi:hypothetical protein
MAKRTRNIIAPQLIEELAEPRVVALQRGDRLKSTHEFQSLAEKVARSSIFQKNYYHPTLKSRFNFADRIKRIDMMFPYAVIGPTDKKVQLLVDFPKNDREVEVCVRKAVMLKELGEHYCYIDPTTTLYDALNQLGVA